MNNLKIEKLDNFGRGICYVNDKITFVTNALPDEIVNIKLTKESKKYNEAIVTEYLKKSPKRIDNICPYYEECGGCNLLHMSYQDTLNFKKDKLESIIYKYAKLQRDIEIIPSKDFNYRNKVTLKIKNYKYGYYKESTHKIIPITKCYIAETAINDFIKDIKYLNVKNGELVIRSNYNNELLLWLKTKEKPNIDIPYLKEHYKISGIILNDQVIDGESSYIELINHQIFTVSYDSFFQINRDICSKLFNLINEYINDNEVILDLYCGVGTLGINASSHAKKTFGIEIVRNAILNAITNAKINKRDNVYYMLGDASKCLPKIKDHLNTIILDPPRAGLDKVTLNTILSFKPDKIIYVSCDPMTLARDLNELQRVYNLEVIKGLDMFAYTNHIETFCVLKLK